MGSQVENGKAFEWAVAKELETQVLKFRKIAIAKSPAQAKALACFLSRDAQQQSNMRGAAGKAIAKIIETLEPRLRHPSSAPLVVSIMPDSAGVAGDVRDVVVLEGADWEIGISAKHNHESTKSPRISREGVSPAWLGLPSTNNWQEKKKPIEDWLDVRKGQAWSLHPDKDVNVYREYIRMLSYELHEHQKSGHPVAARLVQYCLGKNDFYKIIYLPSKKQVVVEAFNFHGTLGASNSLAPLPTRIVRQKLAKNNANLEVIFDKGWAMNFRIHNADSKIKRCGLKFDVTIVGFPKSICRNTLSAL